MSEETDLAGAATLVVLPVEGPDAVPLDTMLLGLSIRDRIRLAAERAGFGGTEFFESGQAAPATAQTSRVIAIPGSVLPSRKWLQEQLLSAGKAAKDSTGYFLLQSKSDLPRAEEWLLSSLVKDTESFMSRHVERKISLAVSRRLVATPITPNQMTFVSVGIGLAGALFFLRSDAVFETIGALLFLLHSILDGCDGELARLKFMESRWGGVLDFWGDNVVHSAVFACMAVGWSLRIHERWPLFLGVSAVAGALLSAGFVFVTTMDGGGEGPLFRSVAVNVNSRTSRVADAVGRRDFIYLILLFSLFGRASWFLVLSAIGSPVFFLVLVFIALEERRRARNRTPERTSP